MPLTVLHKGKGLAVIDKPPGLPVEADGECVLKLLARELAPPGGRAWPRVVHRLDRDTSGCLLVALNDRCEAELLELFQRGEVHKQYLALVQGQPPDHEQLDTPFGPDPRDRRRYTTHLVTPRRARLSYAVERRLRDAALLRIELLTGRTHQIRVQLAESGHPVLGDETYGASHPGLARQALHAARLSLPDPERPGQTLTCEARLPPDLQAVIDALTATH